MKKFIKLNNSLSRRDFFLGDKLIKASSVARLLCKEENTLHHSFSINQMIYIYSFEEGIYIKHEEFDVIKGLITMFDEFEIVVSKAYLNEIFWFIQVINHENKIINNNYISFKNGNFNINTRELEPFSPDIVTISKIPVNYEPNTEIQVWDRLLNYHFRKDAQELLKAFMSFVLKGETKAQVFLCIVGPGGTGKSTIVNVISLLIGVESTLTTTLRDLAQDKFEGTNLIGKRLICINDAEQFTGDLSVIKAITGGDSIQGRIKHQSGSAEIFPEGLIVMASNQYIQTRDPSGALSRRMRILPMFKKPSKVYPLLTRNRTKFNGLLLKEAPGILDWCLMEDDRAYEILTNIEKTPSLVEYQLEAAKTVNPLIDWVETLNIGPQEQAYIGFLSGKIDLPALINQVKTSPSLYPMYLIFCHLRKLKPLSHNKFSTDLMMTLQAKGSFVRKVKTKRGALIQGISVDLSILDSDNLLGVSTSIISESSGSHPEKSQSCLEESKTNPISFKSDKEVISKTSELEMKSEFKREPSKMERTISDQERKTLETPSSSEVVKKPFKTKLNFCDQNHSGSLKLNPTSSEVTYSSKVLFWEERNPELYDFYYSALNKTPFKEEINLYAKELVFDKDKLYKERVGLLSGLKGLKVKGLDYDFGNPSKEYLDHQRKLLNDGIAKIKNNLIPYKYKPLGLSPRILPQGYGDTINSAKKYLREHSYQLIVDKFTEYVILDIDLKSCYTSVLLGLFPSELKETRNAIEGPGLWNYMSKLFEESGRKSLFNKPAVKICVYSSYFGGGPNAMIKGTLDYMRKEIGLKPKQLKETDYYEGLHALARDLAEFVNKTSIIQEFRAVSRSLLKDNAGFTCQGPTGHNYIIDQSQWQSTYTNFLQSFEFYLLAQATLLTLDNFPQAQLIGHYHDGNVIIVPKEQAEGYISNINNVLEDLRVDLKLSYPQMIEHIIIKENI